jgi:hypothetical protein
MRNAVLVHRDLHFASVPDHLMTSRKTMCCGERSVLASSASFARNPGSSVEQTCEQSINPLQVLGGGLEPPCLSAYAPQTYVSAISPPERKWEGKVCHCGILAQGENFA